MTDRRIVFVDLETTGLDSDRHEPWEIALVTGDNAHVWQVPVLFLQHADPGALTVGRFYERGEQVLGQTVMDDAGEIARKVATLTADAHLAGANPAFDAAFLTRWLRRYGYAPAWHHRLIDVEAQTAGALGWTHPRGLRASAEALGVTVDTDVTHTALYDALLAARVYEACVSLHAMETARG